jgi:hypothetical protein
VEQASRAVLALSASPPSAQTSTISSVAPALPRAPLAMSMLGAADRSVATAG